MPLALGTCLGHYDVTSLLGEGGMGQAVTCSEPFTTGCSERARSASGMR